jgi:hypothetical protein
LAALSQGRRKAEFQKNGVGWGSFEEELKKEVGVAGSDSVPGGRITERKENAEGRIRDLEEQFFFLQKMRFSEAVKNIV